MEIDAIRTEWTLNIYNKVDEGIRLSVIWF